MYNLNIPGKILNIIFFYRFGNTFLKQIIKVAIVFIII